MLVHKEHYIHTPRGTDRKHYSHRGRGRNIAGAQRTLMHPGVQTENTIPTEEGVEILMDHRKHYTHTPRCTENTIPTEGGEEMLLEHKEHSRTQKHRKYYSYKRRGRNVAGAQRTLTHPEVHREHSHIQRYRTPNPHPQTLKGKP